jgi:dihydroorotate dehydrogenase
MAEDFLSNFGCAHIASGTLNFYGEGYWYHKIFKFLFPKGFDFSGSIMITKTGTVDLRMPQKKSELGKGRGNLILDSKTWQPKEYFPSCIKVGLIDLLMGRVYNSVAWSNPGLQELSLKWQKLKNPFIISIGFARLTRQDRLQECREAKKILQKLLLATQVPIAIQISVACPNVGNDFSEDVSIEEIIEWLNIFSDLNIYQGIKINVLRKISDVKNIVENARCDWIEIPNTFPISSMRKKSPLEFVGGGVSNRLNFELALKWIREARAQGLTMSIACGGVFCKKDVSLAKKAGADIIAFARMTMLRPWRVKSVIQEDKKTL